MWKVLESSQRDGPVKVKQAGCQSSGHGETVLMKLCPSPLSTLILYKNPHVYLPTENKHMDGWMSTLVQPRDERLTFFSYSRQISTHARAHHLLIINVAFHGKPICTRCSVKWHRTMYFGCFPWKNLALNEVQQCDIVQCKCTSGTHCERTLPHFRIN